MENQKPAGSGMIKVAAILMIIFGAISLLINGFAVSTFSMVSSLVPSDISSQVDSELGNAGINLDMLYFALLLGLAGSVAQIIAGIVGVSNCNKPESGQKCFIWGVIVLALVVVSNVMSGMFGLGFGMMLLITLFIGSILPIIFIIGANKNKQEFAEKSNQAATNNQ